MASSDPNKRPRPGPWPPGPSPTPESGPAMPPSSWAKRTGFRPKFSGETNATDSGPISVQPPPQQHKPREHDANLDLESGRGARPGPTSNGELSPVPEKPAQEKEKEKVVRKRRDSDGAAAPPKKGSRPNGQAVTAAAASGEVAGGQGAGSRRGARNDEVVDMLPQTVLDDDGFISKHSHMKYELRDSPGLGELRSIG